MHDSIARKHYLSLINRVEARAQIGFAPPKSVAYSDLYKQPYAIPNSHVED